MSIPVPVVTDRSSYQTLPKTDTSSGPTDAQQAVNTLVSQQLSGFAMNDDVSPMGRCSHSCCQHQHASAPLQAPEQDSAGEASEQAAGVSGKQVAVAVALVGAGCLCSHSLPLVGAPLAAAAKYLGLKSCWASLAHSLGLKTAGAHHALSSRQVMDMTGSEEMQAICCCCSCGCIKASCCACVSTPLCGC